MQITDMSLIALRDAISRGDVSPAEAAAAYLARAHAVEGDVNAFITLYDDAPQKAKSAACGPLFGVPVALKDNLCVRGGRTTCASRMLEHHISPYSATVWERLSGAGCTLLGKTNMDEFAMGSDTTTGVFGPTRNPHDLTRVAGGSSGGSAAAVAAGEAPLAIGSDTGGSIRQPAAFCGVVGMKPTYGLVSRYGLVAFASSLDAVGPITRNVADNALALSVMAGRDPRDGTTVDHPLDLSRLQESDVRGLRIGVPKQMMNGLADGVRSAVLRAARILEEQGAQVDEVDLPSLPYALSAYCILSCAETSGNLARYDGVRYGYRTADADDLDALYTHTRSEGFGEEVKRRILLGTYVLSAGYWADYYRRAQQVRTMVIRDFAHVFAQVDCLLAPVAPTTAWKIGETPSPVARYQADAHCVPANIAGIPALSVPCGKDENALSIGIQLMGPAFSEPLLYCVGAAIEREVM